MQLLMHESQQDFNNHHRQHGEGKGISFAEGNPEWHSKVIDHDSYERAISGTGGSKWVNWPRETRSERR